MTDFDRFTEQLVTGLSADPDVLGLIVVGSTADASYRDMQSDHDFWLVVTPHAASRYRATCAWLPDATAILIAVEHGIPGRSVLYRDRHRVEYVVFTPTEMPNGKLERHRVLIDRGSITDLANDVASRTLATPRLQPEPLQNLALLVWTGRERLARGECLSAHRYLTGFAVDNLLELLRRHGQLGADATADRLDPRRRLERLVPDVATELHRILALPLPQVGSALLALAEQRVRHVAPDLNWAAISEVRRWLNDVAPA